MGDRTRLLRKGRVFNKKLLGVVRNPKSEFMSHLYLFGSDFDEKNQKYQVSVIKQFDRDLNFQEYRVLRKEKSARNKNIKEVSFHRENEYEYFCVLFEDNFVRVIGFSRSNFGRMPVFEESMSLDKGDVSKVTIRRVQPEASKAELLFLSEDSLCSITLSRNSHLRPMVIKKHVQGFFVFAKWVTKKKKDKQMVFFPFHQSHAKKTDFFLCRHNLDTQKEKFYELPGVCWDLRLLRHFLVVTAKGGSGTKNEHDEVRVIDPINKYVAYRFVPSHFRIRQVWVDHSELLIISEQKEGMEQLLCLAEMEDNDKIDKFMKKNFLRLAHKFASNSGFKPKFLAQLSRVSGDKELEKAKYEEAMHHYKNTIGFLEPSYVLQKFIEKGQVTFNIDYLIALHERNRADEYHIQLLVNCLLEKKKFEELKKWFTELESKESTFAELAIEACLDYGETELAKELARESKRTDDYVRIVIDNFLTCQDQGNRENIKREAAEILNHIRSHSDSKGEEDSWKIRKKNVLEYGPVLMQYDPEGVLRLVKDYLEFTLQTGPAVNEKSSRVSMMAELSLGRETGSSDTTREGTTLLETSPGIREILFLYQRFDEQNEAQTEELIKFLSRHLRKFHNQDKAVISEFIIEFYANKYGKILHQIKRGLAEKKQKRKSSFRRSTMRNPTRLEDIDMSNFVNNSNPLDQQNELVQMSENLGLGSGLRDPGNMSSPMLDLDESKLTLIEENEDKQFDFLSCMTLDGETRKKLVHCEAQVREQLDDPEINRLVDLHYLLILFAQCQMRKAKLKVYDLLKLKKEKLKDLFFNSEYQECMDYCQKNYQDWGNAKSNRQTSTSNFCS